MALEPIGQGNNCAFRLPGRDRNCPGGAVPVDRHAERFADEPERDKGPAANDDAWLVNGAALRDLWTMILIRPPRCDKIAA